MKTISQSMLLLAMVWAVAACLVGCKAFGDKAKETKWRTVNETLAESVESMFSVRIADAHIYDQVSDDEIIQCTRLISKLDQFYILGAKVKRVECVGRDKDKIIVDGYNVGRWFVEFGRDSNGEFKIL